MSSCLYCTNFDNAVLMVDGSGGFFRVQIVSRLFKADLLLLVRMQQIDSGILTFEVLSLSEAVRLDS